MRNIMGGDSEAKLHYLSGDYKVVVPGTHVTCAVTGQRVDLVNLRYWCAVRQEAYGSSEVASHRDQKRTSGTE